jgi:RNA polymerase sigma-54 factor
MMTKVVGLQKEFIFHGERESRPVTRAGIAKELGVHESTISRAVAKKSVQLPNKRIVPLSMFFDRSLNVRTVLREMIADESKPLSDFNLVDLLKKQGFIVARRTVAKYRSMEGILPAHLRHNIG